MLMKVDHNATRCYGDWIGIIWKRKMQGFNYSNYQSYKLLQIKINNNQFIIKICFKKTAKNCKSVLFGSLWVLANKHNLPHWCFVAEQASFYWKDLWKQMGSFRNARRAGSGAGNRTPLRTFHLLQPSCLYQGCCYGVTLFTATVSCELVRKTMSEHLSARLTAKPAFLSVAINSLFLTISAKALALDIYLFIYPTLLCVKTVYKNWNKTDEYLSSSSVIF